MGELGALFNPGMRHELAERQAKAARREEEGNARDGDLRIDLESGVAVINVVGADNEQAATESSQADEANSEATAAGTAAAEDPSADIADAEDPIPEDATAGTPAAQVRPTAPKVKPRGKRGLSHSAR